MAKISLEQKEQRLKALEQKIKAEKKKLNEQLGKAIIESLQIEYSSIDKAKIKEICDILITHYSSDCGVSNE